MIDDDELAAVTGEWDYASLPDNVIVGDGVWIERRDSFDSFRSEQQPGLVLGDRTRVYTWATFNVDPSGRVLVGADSILVGPVFMCRDRIEIGRGCVVSYGVTIADSDFHPIDPDERRRDAVANAPHGDRRSRPRFDSAPVSIDDGAWIGIGAMILKGVTVGAGARVGPGAVLTSDVPPGVSVAGNPARIARR